MKENFPWVVFFPLCMSENLYQNANEQLGCDLASSGEDMCAYVLLIMVRGRWNFIIPSLFSCFALFFLFYYPADV